MEHSTLLGSAKIPSVSLSTVGNRRGGTASLPAPPAGVPKPSMYGGMSERKKGGYPHGRRPEKIHE